MQIEVSSAEVRRSGVANGTRGGRAAPELILGLPDGRRVALPIGEDTAKEFECAAVRVTPLEKL